MFKNKMKLKENILNKYKKTQKVLFVLIVVVIFSFSIYSLSAIEVRFFHSETCPYCKQILPFVMEQANKYPTYLFGIYEISDQDNYDKYSSYGFTGVPAFVINTEDNREIKFVGADSNKLHCELQEMSTKNCLTYSAEESCVEGSWFK